VKTHADAHGGLRRPRMRRKRALGGDGCGSCVRGASKHDEERVPLNVDLVAVMLRERGAKKAAMVGENRAVLFAKLPEQPGRALDVRKEERHRSAGKLTHHSSPFVARVYDRRRCLSRRRCPTRLRSRSKGLRGLRVRVRA
jgi:hypothetical protein